MLLQSATHKVVLTHGGERGDRGDKLVVLL